MKKKQTRLGLSPKYSTALIDVVIPQPKPAQWAKTKGGKVKEKVRMKVTPFMCNMCYAQKKSSTAC